MIHLSRPFRERETGRAPDLALASRTRGRFHPFREQGDAATAAAASEATIFTTATVAAVSAATAVAGRRSLCCHRRRWPPQSLPSLLARREKLHFEADWADFDEVEAGDAVFKGFADWIGGVETDT